MPRSCWMTSLLAAVIALATAPATACGPDSPCVVEDGAYRIRLPATGAPAGKVGAVVFFHGYRGSAERVMRNQALGKAVSKLGLALIAPDGMEGSWSFPGSPRDHRNEFAFVDHVMADALARFPIDGARVMASGFSLGGSMVWQLACNSPTRFAGYAPVAGAFWEPLPQDCMAARQGEYRLPHLFHVHGLADTVVPMQGRPIGQRAHQGDVYEGVDVWLRPLDRRPEPAVFQDSGFNCRRWSDGAAGGLELCLHEGGHSLRAEWVARAWRRLAEVMRWPT